MSSCLHALAIALALAAGCCGAQGDAKRGAYLAKAGGCAGCHTAGAPDAIAFAGGREIVTPFGKFYGPNITSDPRAGIGRWSEADFIRALRLGVRPDGAHYFPAFPYPSFTKIADADLRDLFAYLRSLPASAQPSRQHELGFLYRWRFALWGWKWLFFTPGPFQPPPGVDARVARGAYLAGALGHCGECHTPRNALGGLRKGREFAGGRLPEGRTPNLTPTRLKRWSDPQLAEFLRSGATPEGDAPADTMYEVIRNTTSQLTTADLAALIAYLRSVPALPDEPKSK